MGYDKRFLEAMEEVRASGVCNMFDRVCVCGELQDNHGIYITKHEFPKLLNEFAEYKKSEKDV